MDATAAGAAAARYAARRGRRRRGREPRSRGPSSPRPPQRAPDAGARRGPGARSSARPWPSLRSPAASSSSASSGRSSRRSRFETATRERPTRRPISSRVSPSSSTSSAQARASSTGVEVLAGHVLDQRELERGGVVVRAHERGNRLEPGEPRGAPAALAGDQLVGAARQRPDEHRLEDAAFARASRRARAAPPRRSAAAAGAGSASISSTGSSRSSASRSPSRSGADDRIAASPRPMPRVRSATRRHLLGQLEVCVRARAVRIVVDDRPAEARRLAEPHVARDDGVEDELGKCSRTSRSTSWASLVRASCIVSSMPGDREARVELALDQRERVEQAGEALEREVLGLDRARSRGRRRRAR